MSDVPDLFADSSGVNVGSGKTAVGANVVGGSVAGGSAKDKSPMLVQDQN